MVMAGCPNILKWQDPIAAAQRVTMLPGITPIQLIVFIVKAGLDDLSRGHVLTPEGRL